MICGRAGGGWVLLGGPCSVEVRGGGCPGDFPMHLPSSSLGLNVKRLRIPCDFSFSFFFLRREDGLKPIGGSAPKSIPDSPFRLPIPKQGSRQERFLDLEYGTLGWNLWLCKSQLCDLRGLPTSAGTEAPGGCEVNLSNNKGHAC